MSVSSGIVQHEAAKANGTDPSPANGAADHEADSVLAPKRKIALFSAYLGAGYAVGQICKSSATLLSLASIARVSLCTVYAGYAIQSRTEDN